MKTIITSAITMISFFSFGQNIQLSNSLFAESMELLNPEHHVFSKTSQVSSFAQRDSSNYWFWDLPNSNWQSGPKTKDINYVYDSHNNITGFLRKTWTGSAWKNSGQYSFTYDANNNLTSSSYKTWNGNFWENYLRYTYSYDSNSNLIYYIYESGSDSSWTNVDKRSYTYNNSNQKTGFLVQSWNGGLWENVDQHVYNYDVNNPNKMVSHLGQEWQSNAWVNDNRDTCIYNSDGNLSMAIFDDWNGTSWENLSRLTYVYNANGEQIAFTREIWNASAWENKQRCDMTYLNGKLKSESFQNWNATVWENDYKNFYTWGGENNMTMTNYLLQNWNGTQWKNTMKYDQNFDVNGFLQSEINVTWDNTGAVTSADSSYHYTHLVATGIKDLAQTKSFSVYPNPAISELNISTVADYKSIRIVNALGETIRVQEDKPEQISVSQLTNGVYFVQLIDKKGGLLGTKRFVKD